MSRSLAFLNGSYSNALIQIAETSLDVTLFDEPCDCRIELLSPQSSLITTRSSGLRPLWARLLAEIPFSLDRAVITTVRLIDQVAVKPNPFREIRSYLGQLNELERLNMWCTSASMQIRTGEEQSHVERWSNGDVVSSQKDSHMESGVGFKLLVELDPSHFPGQHFDFADLRKALALRNSEYPELSQLQKINVTGEG